MTSLIVMHKHINNVSFFHVNIQVSSRECSFGITIHQVFKVGGYSGALDLVLKFFSGKYLELSQLSDIARDSFI